MDLATQISNFGSNIKSKIITSYLDKNKDENARLMILKKILYYKIDNQFNENIEDKVIYENNIFNFAINLCFDENIDEIIMTKMFYILFDMKFNKTLAYIQTISNFSEKNKFTTVSLYLQDIILKSFDLINTDKIKSFNEEKKNIFFGQLITYLIKLGVQMVSFTPLHNFLESVIENINGKFGEEKIVSMCTKWQDFDFDNYTEKKMLNWLNNIRNNHYCGRAISYNHYYYITEYKLEDALFGKDFKPILNRVDTNDNKIYISNAHESEVDKQINDASLWKKCNEYKIKYDLKNWENNGCGITEHKIKGYDISIKNTNHYKDIDSFVSEFFASSEDEWKIINNGIYDLSKKLDKWFFDNGLVNIKNFLEEKFNNLFNRKIDELKKSYIELNSNKVKIIEYFIIIIATKDKLKYKFMNDIKKNYSDLFNDEMNENNIDTLIKLLYDDNEDEIFTNKTFITTEYNLLNINTIEDSVYIILNKLSNINKLNEENKTQKQILIKRNKRYIKSHLDWLKLHIRKLAKIYKVKGENVNFSEYLQNIQLDPSKITGSVTEPTTQLATPNQTIPNSTKPSEDEIIFQEAKNKVLKVIKEIYSECDEVKDKYINNNDPRQTICKKCGFKLESRGKHKKQCLDNQGISLYSVTYTV